MTAGESNAARRRWALPVALLTIVSALSPVWPVLREVTKPADPAAKKLQAAERFTHYSASKARGPRFALRGGVRSFRVVSHAVLPPGRAYDPARIVTYGLRFAVSRGGQELWSHELHTRSRQSKARLDGALWLDEGAFSLEQLQLTDSRDTLLDLPSGLPPDAELSVTLVQDPREPDPVREVVVRLLSQVEQSDWLRELRRRTLEPSVREQLAERVSYLPWERLSRTVQLERLRMTEQQLAPLGRPNRDYKVRTVYTTRFRLPGPVAEDPSGFQFSDGHHAAINVVGPAALNLELYAPVGVTAVVTCLGGDGPCGPWTFKSTTEARQTFPLALPEGVHTLIVRSSSPTLVQARLFSPTAAALHGADAQSIVAATSYELLPKVVEMRGYESGPGLDPVVAVLDGPDDDAGRLVRIEVRLLEGDGHLLLETEDLHGQRHAEAPVPLSSPPATFEQALFAGGRIAPVSEPRAVYFRAPVGTRRVLLGSTRAALLGISTLAGVTSRRSVALPPYDTTSGGMGFRYAPRVGSRFVAMRAGNEAELGAARVVSISMQVRLDESTRDVAVQAGARVIEPQGRTRRQLVIEPVASKDVPRLSASWTPSACVVLVPAKPLRISARGRAELTYWADAPSAALGQEVEVLVDGASAVKKSLVTARGVIRLHDIAGGTRTIEIRTAARGLHFLLNQAPLERADLYVVRSLHALDAEGLRVAIDKPGKAPLTVNAVLYGTEARSDSQSRVRVRIDGGAPRVVSRVSVDGLTKSDETLPLPDSDRPPIHDALDGSKGPPLWSRHLAIKLGDDLAPGPHVIELVSLGRGRATWGRFFVLGEEQRGERAFQWLESNEEQVDE